MLDFYNCQISIIARFLYLPDCENMKEDITCFPARFSALMCRRSGGFLILDQRWHFYLIFVKVLFSLFSLPAALQPPHVLIHLAKLLQPSLKLEMR